MYCSVQAVAYFSMNLHNKQKGSKSFPDVSLTGACASFAVVQHSNSSSD